MSETPISLKVPPRCERCNTPGRVHLEELESRIGVFLHWRCRACDAVWPVRRGDAVSTSELQHIRRSA